MSSSNHPIIVPSDSDIEDAFSSTNVPDYFPASPGNTSPDSSNDLTKIALEDPIAPQLLCLISSVIHYHHCLFRDLFPPERFSPPKDIETPVESPIPISPSSSSRIFITNAPPRNITSAAPSAMTQACNPAIDIDVLLLLWCTQAAPMAILTIPIGTPDQEKLL
ncbi:hypothetical protein Tco_0553260 [Tanacetum coccineum]